MKKLHAVHYVFPVQDGFNHFAVSLIVYVCSTPQFPDLPVRPNKAEVLQLDGGGVLLVWKPVQSSDPVTYCVQYCTDGGFTEMMQQHRNEIGRLC